MRLRYVVLITAVIFTLATTMAALERLGYISWYLQSVPVYYSLAESIPYFYVLVDLVLVAIPIMVLSAWVIGFSVRQARTQRNLKISEQRLRDFVSSASEWLWETDADLRVTYLPEQFQIATGRSIATVMGKRRTDFAQYDETDPAWQRHLEDLAARRPFRNFEYRTTADDGRTAYLSVSGVPIFDEDGSFAGYRGTGRLITQRKLAEEQLRESQNLLRAVIDAVPAMISLKDRDARYVLINRYQARAFGLDMDNAVGKTAEEIINTPAARQFTANDRKVLATGDPYLNFEQLWIDPHGLTHYLIVNKVPLLDDSGTPTHVVSVGLDVTERRRMEESAMRLASAMESIAELFLVCDADDRIILTNQKFREINRFAFASADIGVTFEEHIRRIVAAGLVVDAIGREEDWIAERLDRHRNPRGPFEVHRQEGRTLLVHEYRLRDGGTATVGTDVTSLKKAQAELRVTQQEAEIANRAKTEFLANMSHELRTPLNSIIGFTDILYNRRFGRDDPRYDAYLKDVNDAGRDLLNLINDIIDISRIERGQMSLSERSIDVPRLMTSCYRLVLGRAHEMQIHFDLNLPDDCPALHADERRVKQALLNVLSNAVKFTLAGGTVEFGASLDEDGGIAFTVKDSGIGIKAEDIPRVMSVFGQADGSLARRHEGSGLGLPLARDLMELHGGNLRLDSRPGMGTTVTLSFPSSRTVRSA